MSAHQKRAPDLIIDGHEPPCGCWELHSGSLEEQAVLLTSEPSLQPYIFYYMGKSTLFSVMSVHYMCTLCS